MTDSTALVRPVMAKRKTAASPSKPRRDAVELNLDLLLARAREVLRSDGFVARAKLAKMGISREQAPDVIAALEREGFEVTSKVVRVPLIEQLNAKLAHGSALSLKTIGRAVVGGSKAEVVAAIMALVARREAHYVVRSTELTLFGPRTDVLDEGDLGSLESVIAELAKVVKLARRRDATLLRADVERTLARLGSVSRPRVGKPFPSERALAELIDRHREKTGLTFVPALVRLLGGAAVRDEAHAALLQGARAGIFELRPESGMGRLTAEDVTFCVPGPQGSHLSWVRRLSP